MHHLTIDHRSESIRVTEGNAAIVAGTITAYALDMSSPMAEHHEPDGEIVFIAGQQNGTLTFTMKPQHPDTSAKHRATNECIAWLVAFYQCKVPCCMVTINGEGFTMEKMGIMTHATEHTSAWSTAWEFRLLLVPVAQPPSITGEDSDAPMTSRLGTS